MAAAIETTTFKPKNIVKKLLTALPERSKTVLEARFGLGTATERVTLEAIGNTYGITRERVRQIENHALATLKKQAAFVEASAAFGELEQIIDSLGGIICEDELLNYLTRDKSLQNYIYFLLVLGDPFKFKKEDEETERCWYVDTELAAKIEGALSTLYHGLSDE